MWLVFCFFLSPLRSVGIPGGEMFAVQWQHKFEWSGTIIMWMWSVFAARNRIGLTGNMLIQFYRNQQSTWIQLQVRAGENYTETNCNTKGLKGADQFYPQADLYGVGQIWQMFGSCMVSVSATWTFITPLVGNPRLVIRNSCGLLLSWQFALIPVQGGEY